MKVVLDNIVFALQRAGGISVVWQNLLEGVIKYPDINRTFIEYPNTNIFRNKIVIPENEIINDKLGFLNYKRYLNIPCKVIDEGFVFHSSYYRTSTNPLAKNVTTVHDFTYDYFNHGIKKAVHCHQRNHAIRNSDAIICISENTRNDLIRILPEIDISKIHIIYNGVSNDYNIIADANNDYKDFIMFVGSRLGYKNFKFAVEAIKQTKFRLLICGNDITTEEKKLLDKSLGSDRYEVKIRPSNHELNILYNSVFCLLYPSSYEGFGIPVLEAQRAGCPVIAYNASSIPEIIGDKTLLMDNLTVTDFNGKVSILRFNSHRSDIVKAGLENAKKYSWDKMSKEYISLYHHLLP